MEDADPRATGRAWTMLYALSAVLILSFLWRFLVTANEYPSQLTRWMTLLFDGAMVVGLFGLRPRTVGAEEPDNRQGFGQILFWIALLAGLGLFAIRLLGGRAAWMTGHRLYDCCPPR